MPPKRKFRETNSNEGGDEPRRAKKRDWSAADYSHIGPSDGPKKKKMRYKNHIFNQSVSVGR